MVLTLNYMFAKGAWFWLPSSNDGALADAWLQAPLCDVT